MVITGISPKNLPENTREAMVSALRDIGMPAVWDSAGEFVLHIDDHRDLSIQEILNAEPTDGLAYTLRHIFERAGGLEAVPIQRAAPREGWLKD